MMDLIIKTAPSIHEIDPDTWNQLSGDHPFQSHRWYAFGEKIMMDCPPTYLLVYNNNNLVARATFWLIRNEPLPDLQPVLRSLVMSLLKHWPLFICRSPLSNATGLILPKDSSRMDILSALARAAIQEATFRGASFVVFDYLREEETQGWPPEFCVEQISDPGTIMYNRWDSLNAFLSDGKKKDRQHHKRTLRESEKLGIQLGKYEQVPNVESALALIRNVDKHYGNAPNPWMQNLLDHMDEIEGTWLEARIGNRLVGGGLILEDNSAQMTTALGLAEDVPYAYLLLIYTSLEVAFEKQVRLLRWGSGAYEVKQRFGFSKLDDNFVTFAGSSLIPRIVTKFF